jgi:hypothetical protein
MDSPTPGELHQYLDFIVKFDKVGVDFSSSTLYNSSMTISSETLIEFTQLKIDQQASKLALSERIEQQLLITHNGGLFKATTELISFLSVWDADELYLSDMYNTPVKINRNELLTELKQTYQSVMNEWHCEFEQLKKLRRGKDLK